MEVTHVGLHRTLQQQAKQQQLNILMQQGLEKYLMTKIYYKTFAQSELDRERDVALTQRMAALNFVQPHHLDIPKHYQEDNASQLAIKELHKINNYKVCLCAAN